MFCLILSSSCRSLFGKEKRKVGKKLDDKHITRAKGYKTIRVRAASSPGFESRDSPIH
jgi:hypothetical protein